MRLRCATRPGVSIYGQTQTRIIRRKPRLFKKNFLMGIRTQPAHKRGRETTETPGVATIMQPTHPFVLRRTCEGQKLGAKTISITKEREEQQRSSLPKRTGQNSNLTPSEHCAPQAQPNRTSSPQSHLQTSICIAEESGERIISKQDPSKPKPFEETREVQTISSTNANVKTSKKRNRKKDCRPHGKATGRTAKSNPSVTHHCTCSERARMATIEAR